MPGENIQDWSVTASNNGIADSLINWQEGQARASVNDSARSMMAAVAKHRNLTNGSIVTGGTANAQTFTSGVGYTSIPAGLRVLLKIGITNTGAATLDMDGIGPTVIAKRSTQSLEGGDLTVGDFAEFVYQGGYWQLLPNRGAFAAGYGRLIYLSPTTIGFQGYNNGGHIKINGAMYSVAGSIWANTDVTIDGLTHQNLAANSTYYVFLQVIAGAPTVNYRTLAWSHSPSQSNHNLGVEVLSLSGTQYDEFSLVGMVQTNASAQFQDTATARGVISWFNRRNLPLRGAGSSGALTTSTSPAELSTSYRAYFLMWAEEGTHVGMWGNCHNDTTGVVLNPAVWVDNSFSLIAHQINSPTAYFAVPLGGAEVLQAADGWHFVSPVAYVSGGTGAFFITATAMIRG